MTPEIEFKPRHLVIGEQTKSVKIGAEILGGDPSAVRYLVGSVREDGTLMVEIIDLLSDSIRIAPMPVGTSVVIQDQR